MKIIIAPCEIAGMGQRLALGLNNMGIDAKLALGWAHPFGYESIHSEGGKLFKLWQSAGVIRAKVPRSNLLYKLSIIFFHKLLASIILFYAITQFDIFIFIFGETFTNSTVELWLLKLLRKKTIFIFCGSDARPPFVDGAIYPHGCSINFADVRKTTARQKRKISTIERLADICINSPSSGQFHNKPFINWFAMGIPINDSRKENFIIPKEGIVRILHSPSSPAVKGSDRIFQAIDNLKQRGYSIELITITNKPNETVIEELEKCDFVVDQLYSDTPMAGFATEAAAMGKPAVVGGYFSMKIQSYLLGNNTPPSLFVHPDRLEQAIEKMIVDINYRQDLGRKAKEFVLGHWSQEEVARRYLRLLKGDIPEEWWCDPRKIRYVHGCGMPEEHAKTLARGLIERYGKASLQLSDKPELERAFVEFAGLDSERIQ